MPDPAKLKSFLDRTTKAMQDAVDRGDQAGVDQYEKFLDRANAVGERLIGQQGPQGQPGPKGLAGVVPPEQEAPPTLQPPTSKIQQDIEGESMPPPGAKKPSQAAEYEAWALKHQQDTPDTLHKYLFGDRQPTPPALTDTQTPAQVMQGTSAGMGFGGPTYDAVTPALQVLQKGLDAPSNLMNMINPGVKPAINAPPNASLVTPAVDPEEGPVANGPYLGTPDTTGPSSDELYKTTLGAGYGKQDAKPDGMEEPKFFSLHRLAQILLTGAPSAVRSFDQEKGRYDNRKNQLEDRKYMAGVRQQDQTWHAQVQAMKDKTESQKAMATLLPHLAREKARPFLLAADKASTRMGDMMRMIPPPAQDDPRMLALQREVDENLRHANEATAEAFAPLNPKGK